MIPIHLVAVGAAGHRWATARGEPGTGERDDGVALGWLNALAAPLAHTFRASCHVRAESLDAGFAFDPVRNQYHSTAILQRLDALRAGQPFRVLGVTPLDLYVPVLTFVFGEAQLGGACALVSLRRLQDEFYGLPANNDRAHERLIKEAVHELGHTFGLRHCDDWRCVMASTHAVERLDIKTAEFCSACRQQVEQTASAGSLA